MVRRTRAATLAANGAAALARQPAIRSDWLLKAVWTGRGVFAGRALLAAVRFIAPTARRRRCLYRPAFADYRLDHYPVDPLGAEHLEKEQVGRSGEIDARRQQMNSNRPLDRRFGEQIEREPGR